MKSVLVVRNPNMVIIPDGPLNLMLQTTVKLAQTKRKKVGLLNNLLINSTGFTPRNTGIHSHPSFKSCLLLEVAIDQFRYIKIQPKTIDLSTRLLGVNPTNSVFIPTSLVLRSIVLG